MKRILSILLALVMILSSVVFSFADSLSDMNAVPFATIKYDDGIAASYPENGIILFEKDGKVSVLIKDLDNPTGLAVDEAGNLYFSETGTDTIYKLTEETSKVSVYSSELLEPMGLCWNKGVLYAAETGKNRIVSISGETVTVIAGIAVAEEDDSDEYEGAYRDGAVAKARFDHPQGVFAWDDGRIYVSDTNNHVIRLIENGQVYTVWDNDDLSDELVKPGDLWLEENTLYVRDRFAETTLSKELTSKTFSDVKASHWAYEQINEAAKRHLIEGMSETIFSPDTSLSKAQFVQMLANIYNIIDGTAVINGDSTFDDVTDTAWYHDAIAWAADNGIIAAGGNFNPNAAITRSEMFVMLYKFAINLDEKAPQTADLSAYKDVSSINSDATDAFSWLVATGIVEGYPDSTLRPASGATRAEAVKILLYYLAL